MFGNAIHKPHYICRSIFIHLALCNTQLKLFPGEKIFKLKTQQGRVPN